MGNAPSAEGVREAIQRGRHDTSTFRAALLDVPPNARDVWLDAVLGLGELPADGPELPRGCVPYLPCPVDVLLGMVEQAEVHASDVFVDIGSGVGRAAAFVHLLTGASAMAIEIQPALALAGRELMSRLLLTRVTCVQGDAAKLTERLTVGSVFFLYCPFSGEHLERVLEPLESLAQTRVLRICCVDLALPPRGWLTRDASASGNLTVYRTALQ